MVFKAQVPEAKPDSASSLYCSGSAAVQQSFCFLPLAVRTGVGALLRSPSTDGAINKYDLDGGGCACFGSRGGVALVRAPVFKLRVRVAAYCTRVLLLLGLFRCVGLVALLSKIEPVTVKCNRFDKQWLISTSPLLLLFASSYTQLTLPPSLACRFVRKCEGVTYC